MITPKTIKDRLDEIVCSEENTDKLYSIFNSVDGNSLPLINISIDVGGFVIRQRINDTGKDFSKISDLSYPPASCCKRYGRANLPFHPVFYCSFFPGDPNAPYPRYITLLETSSFALDMNSVGIERSTCTRWDIIKKLNLIALHFSDNYKRSISDIEQIKLGWKNEIAKATINKDALDLVNYMSNEIAIKVKDEIEYFKIANFVFYLLYINNKTKQADGIIYPSVAAAGEGFNIALKTESVDNKLKFVSASLCYLIKDKLDAHLIIKNHSVGQKEDGTLMFKDREDYNGDTIEGINFIN